MTSHKDTALYNNAPGSPSHRNLTSLALSAQRSDATPSPSLVDAECLPICLHSNKQTLIWHSNAFSVQTCETIENLLYRVLEIDRGACQTARRFCLGADQSSRQPVIIESNVTGGRRRHRTEITSFFLPAVYLQQDEGSLKQGPKGRSPMFDAVM